MLKRSSFETLAYILSVTVALKHTSDCQPMPKLHNHCLSLLFQWTKDTKLYTWGMQTCYVPITVSCLSFPFTIDVLEGSYFLSTFIHMLHHVPHSHNWELILVFNLNKYFSHASEKNEMSPVFISFIPFLVCHCFFLPFWCSDWSIPLCFLFKLYLKIKKKAAVK